MFEAFVANKHRDLRAQLKGFKSSRLGARFLAVAAAYRKTPP